MPQAHANSTMAQMLAVMSIKASRESGDVVTITPETWEMRHLVATELYARGDRVPAQSDGAVLYHADDYSWRIKLACVSEPVAS